MSSSRKNDENQRPLPPKQTDNPTRDTQALPTITERSGNVNFGYNEPSTASPANSSIQGAAGPTSADRTRPRDPESASSFSHQVTGHRGAAGPHDASRQIPATLGSIDNQLHSPLSDMRSDHATANEDVALYENPLDMEFPLNFDDSARREDYHGDGDLLSKRFRLMRMEYFDYVRSIKPPVGAGLALSTFVTGRARAMNPAQPKSTRLCFATRFSPGHAHRVHEIHAYKLEIIRKHCPEKDFPQLYPLILRYFVSHVTLLGSQDGEETTPKLG